MFAIADVKSDATKTLARVAELVDACASGAYVLTDVEVQVLSRVLNSLSELASARLFFLPYVIYYQNLSVDLAKQCFAVQVLSRVLNSSTDIASVGLFLF